MKVLFALAGAFGAAGCTGDEIKWTEEVKLHDGKVIQLKRRTELSTTGFPVQQRGRPTYHEFCYPPLGVYWKSKPQYRPEAFDIVSGRAYAKVSLGTDCTRCMLHGYPETDALYFRWEGGAWKKIEYKDYPPEIRLNLLMSQTGRDRAEDAHGLVTLAEKRKKDPTIHLELEARGAKGLNELPEIKGACNKCKAINTTTNDTPEIFLASNTSNCE